MAYQVTSLHEWDNAFNRDVTGLRMGHKLQFEQFYLNPNSRMRVNLAAQVRIALFLFCYCFVCVFSTLLNIFSIICPEKKE